MPKLNANQQQELNEIRTRFEGSDNEEISSTLKQIDNDLASLKELHEEFMTADDESKKLIQDEIDATENLQSYLLERLQLAVQQSDEELNRQIEAATESAFSDTDVLLDDALANSSRSSDASELDDLYDDLINASAQPLTAPEVLQEPQENNDPSAPPLDAVSTKSDEEELQSVNEAIADMKKNINAKNQSVAQLLSMLEARQHELNEKLGIQSDATPTTNNPTRATTEPVSASLANSQPIQVASEERKKVFFTRSAVSDASSAPESKLKSIEQTVVGVAEQGINIAARFINSVRRGEAAHNSNPALEGLQAQKNDPVVEKQQLREFQRELNDTVKEMDKFTKIIKNKPSQGVKDHAVAAFKICDEKLEALSKKMESVINDSATTKKGRDALLDLTSTLVKQQNKSTDAIAKAEKSYDARPSPR